MKRITLIAIAALALAAGAGVMRPATANAQVNFSDGPTMMGVYDCKDQWGYSNSAAAMGVSTSVFQSQWWAQGYLPHLDLEQPDAQLDGSPRPGSPWGRARSCSTAPPRGRLGRGYFTFYAELGRYINGRFVSALDTPDAMTCFFVG